ncbi:mucin [Hyphomicrobium nitrativorans NL23]|uniref:Mucin n=1 Tax=Hyphomicrobium nitrativorans NL23 TaxID=1029756 RepID=V5SG98_9HYPH|nr:hypothetical protein [Hyphomicrobium nitrativorans]AHB49070.1 mucin [Hyphomicrobium nitrativorans NL23]
MKRSITSTLAIFAAVGALSTVAIATDRPTQKGPPQTMGDEGKLPASQTLTNKVPDMVGPDTGATGTSTGTSGSSSPKGPAHRMGDEAGKLPATGTVSGAVPNVRGPSQ